MGWGTDLKVRGSPWLGPRSPLWAAAIAARSDPALLSAGLVTVHMLRTVLSSRVSSLGKSDCLRRAGFRWLAGAYGTNCTGTNSLGLV
jgi:hypothetical protein